jgi:hypothetical protein
VALSTAASGGFELTLSIFCEIAKVCYRCG